MRKRVSLILGALLAVNGLLMLLVPAVWYARTPGVVDTGPLNLHFVRDIGCAYLVAGAALVWVGLDSHAWGAGAVGAAFLALHAGVHLWDTVSGRESWSQLLIDLLPVFGPAILAMWIIWPSLLRKAEGDCSDFHR